MFRLLGSLPWLSACYCHIMYQSHSLDCSIFHNALNVEEFIKEIKELIHCQGLCQSQIHDLLGIPMRFWSQQKVIVHDFEPLPTSDFSTQDNK